MATLWAEVPANSSPSFWYFQFIHDWLPTPFFHTQAFFLFFLVAFTVYWLIPRRCNNARVLWLVLCSFHFYAAWSFELAFLVTATTVADYLLARWLDSRTSVRLRKLILGLSLTMNLGVLAYFKYMNFFLDSLRETLMSLGFAHSISTLEIIVPFGISFYTFEAISYVVDVYRRTLRAEKSLPHFMLFILFFPHLVAGPIVRAGDFLPQAHRRKHWNWLRMQVGVQFFLLGLFKKLAIADRMALFCNEPLAHPELHSTGTIWLAVLAFSIRIYADFSGYSDMAIGLAHLLGFRLTQNFNMPYAALNISDFWRRWHISLSSWLRDYLFIPLGGSRGGRWSTRRNLMIVMLLGGLWHGASWSYLVWGALHGLMLIIHRRFREFCETRPRYQAWLDTSLGKVVRMGTTFFWVSLAWIFFRPDLAGAWEICQRLFIPEMGQGLKLHPRSLYYTVVFMMICHVVVARGWWQKWWERAPSVCLGIGYALCFNGALLLAPQDGQGFIYFQF